eukprot:Clim_evm133s157 gene=Clim_evmTU133s157
MSSATKMKHVAREALEEYPEVGEKQAVARVVNNRGGDLFTVVLPDGTEHITQMPTKFQKRLWIKRNDYVIIEFITELTKVTAEIAHVLYSDQQKHLRKIGQWPKEFEEEKATEEPAVVEDDGEDDGEDGDEHEEEDDFFASLKANKNRTYEIEDV